MGVRRWRSYEEYTEDQANKLGLLLDDPTLHYSLSLVDPSEGEKPSVDVGRHRITIPSHQKYISERYDGEIYGRSYSFDWEENWRDLPFVIMERAFSVEELCKIKWNSFIMSEVSEEFHYNPKYRTLGKVSNALHHWCYGKKNYNQLVYWYNALSRFSFGDIPDVEVRFDYATYHNEYGYSKYTRTYLDGPFGYIIYYKGEHVLTIGFAPSAHGLLITQIQTNKKKGNRWLYKLPCHYVEYVVRQMAEAFHDTPIFIADGVSLADRIRASYHKDERHQFTEEKRQHVISVYNREFKQFKRTGEQVTVKNTVFNRLIDVNHSEKNEWFHPSMNYQPYKDLEAVA